MMQPWHWHSGKNDMKMPHTGSYRGKRVRVVLRDGTILYDRFIERTDKYVFLEKAGRIPKAKFRAMSDVRHIEPNCPHPAH